LGLQSHSVDCDVEDWIVSATVFGTGRVRPPRSRPRKARRTSLTHHPRPPGTFRRHRRRQQPSGADDRAARGVSGLFPPPLAGVMSSRGSHLVDRWMAGPVLRKPVRRRRKRCLVLKGPWRLLGPLDWHAAQRVRFTLDPLSCLPHRSAATGGRLNLCARASGVA
jgi:hypothetical protein